MRGILLAYHALAYICLFYRAAVETGLTKPEAVRGDLNGLLDGLDDSESTLRSHREALTREGQGFLDRTIEVADHARQ